MKTLTDIITGSSYAVDTPEDLERVLATILGPHPREEMALLAEDLVLDVREFGWSAVGETRMKWMHLTLS